MRRLVPILTVAALLGLAACQPAAVVTTDPGVAPPATVAELPAGSQLDLRLQQAIGVDATPVGQTFTAEVVEPVVTPAGETAVPAGAVVQGRVTGVSHAVDGQPAAVRVDFDNITIDGRQRDFDARVVDTDARTAADAVLSTEAAIGAAAGAALGLIIEGDLLSALIGGALGAGAGTAIALGTGDVEPTLSAGTRLTVQTTENVALR